MPTFLMKCPNCGKHFDVERTSDKVERKEEVLTVNRAQELMKENIGSPVYIPMVVDEIDEASDSDEVETIPVEKVVHEETFKCKHCGHTWTETR